MIFLKVALALLALPFMAFAFILGLPALGAYMVGTRVRTGNWYYSKCHAQAYFYAPQWWVVKLSLRSVPDHPYHEVKSAFEWSIHVTPLGRQLAFGLWFCMFWLAVFGTIFVTHLWSK